MRIGRIWRLLTLWAIFLGLVADVFNLRQFWHLRTASPQDNRLVYEDFRVSELPDCAFEAIIREEAEPAFYWNMFEWAGLGMAATSAYANAEYKIWLNFSSSDRSSVGGRGFSSSKQVEILRELIDERGLRFISRIFYFDKYGYHAQVVMGRPRQERVLQYSACPVDLDRGRFEDRTVSTPFTCKNLGGVIAEGARRIAAADSASRCWVSYDYEIDYKAERVNFRERYFVWTEGGARDVGSPSS